MNLKLTLLSFSFIIINIFTSQGQSTIPNGGFDDWTTITYGTQTYEYPEGDWNENLLNIGTRFGTGIGFFEKYAESDANGNAVLVRRNPGNLNDGFIRFECDSVPLKLKGRYKFSQSDYITDTDTLRVRVHFSKVSDTISKIGLFNPFTIHPNTREFETTIKKSDFTDFEIDLEDIATNGEHYDYAVIRLMIKGGSQSFYTASTAVFDDLEFEYSDTVLSTDETLAFNKKIEVYPNPVTETVNIQFSEKQSEVTILLYNNIGQLLLHKKSTTIQEYSINMNDFPKGVYYIKINSRDKTGVKKIIKK